MLPTGTITFLFTDIEGSTPAWEQHPGEMHRALEQHNTILRQVTAAHKGQVFKIVGDEFQVAFTDPAQAVEAAIEIQRRIISAQWPAHIGPLRVRMGIHTGEAQPDGSGDYVSTHTLNRVARICSAGHGGQILISLVSVELAREGITEKILFNDLGEHRLKGLSHPEHLFQVVTHGLPQDFPPLITLTRSRHNLPLPRTAFIGRDKEISQVQSLVENSRLVTLTGIGGVGKTRLSLQVAHELLQDFPGGVWWVELAPVSDPERIVDTIAEVLSVHEQPDRPMIETLEAALCEDKHLLVLDNCEHLIEACAHLVDRLLRNCRELHIMASSREPLHVEGEVSLRVPTLSLPEMDCTDVEGLLASEAAQLFLERARAALPEFELTELNCQAVLQVCQRLDGIPLAIELAASRVSVMQVSQIAVRLDHTFQLLASGSRTALPRHQTLQATIDWSYQLLSQEEKVLFERLSIFGGSWTLQAAEAICTDQDIEEYLILDLLTNLTDKSLVILDRRPSKEGRYRFLETIRQYARQKLESSGQVAEFRKRHLNYYLAYAEENVPGLKGEDELEALKQMELEADNFRTAMSWSITDPEAAEESIRLVVGLGEYWLLRGNLHEGRQWLSEVLANEQTCACPEERAKALHIAARMAYRQSDYNASKAGWEECLHISRQLGETGRQYIHLALTGLGMTATEVGDYQTAPQLFAEALEIARQLGDERSQADVLRNLGWAAMRPGDYQLAKGYLEEALSLFRKLNHEVGLASTLSGLGEMALRQGDLKRAQSLVEESLALRRELEDKWGIGASLGTLGWAALADEDYEEAQRILGESLIVRQELGDKGGIAWCLEKLALAAQQLGQNQRAARLYGAASAIRRSIDSVIDPVDQAEYEKQISALRRNLGEEDYQAFWAQGQAMSLDEAVAEGQLGYKEGMETHRKLCLKQQTQLRKLMGNADKHQEAITMFLDQHAMLHSAKITPTECWSFEDAIFEDMSDEQLRRIPLNCEHSVVWCIWHITRIEDIAMNILVASSSQVLYQKNWLEQMNLTVQHSGNSMDGAAVADLSNAIDIEALRAYRVAVGRRTREIVKSLQPEDLKHKVEPARIRTVMDVGALVEPAREIADYWSRRTVGGLLLMPASRHLLVHLNEALNLKRRRH